MTNLLDSICYDNLVTIVVYFLYIFMLYAIIRICYISLNNNIVSKKNKENYR
jgi:hypothetical protein